MNYPLKCNKARKVVVSVSFETLNLVSSNNAYKNKVLTQRHNVKPSGIEIEVIACNSRSKSRILRKFIRSTTPISCIYTE